MSNTLTIARREFRSYFNSPAAYIVAVLFLEMLDRRVRSRGDLELDVPLLAVLNAPGSVGRHLGWSGAKNRSLSHSG